MSGSIVDSEKAIHESGPGPKPENKFIEDADIEASNGEVLLRVDGGNSGLKLAKDGHTVLVPQPSSDPNDPLNWSSTKKHTILLILAFCAFCGDFQSGAGIPLLSIQAEEWNMTLNGVNEAGNLNVLMLGLGGLIWNAPCAFWGRLPVLFWTQLLGTFMQLGSCLSPDFNTYYAFRPLTSVFLTAGQIIGLLFIKDMFYFHEHARKIGIWILIFLISPYCGPLLGGHITASLGTWQPTMWTVFAFSCFMLLMIILFADETYYDRTTKPEDQPHRGKGIGARIANLVGITGARYRGNKPSVVSAYMRTFELFWKPIIWFIIIIYALSFMWSVGINITSSILLATPVEAGGYGLTLRVYSFVYFTPIVALLIGEAFGHFANDWVANRYIRKHDGVFRPEARLPPYFVAIFLMIPGLILVGQALEKQLTLAAVIIGWGMYVVGVMIASVAITAYALDTYPSAASEIGAVVNLARTMSGFSVGYYQTEWAAQVGGFGTSFGIQGALVGVAGILTAVVLFFGGRIREFSGGLKFGGGSSHH